MKIGNVEFRLPWTRYVDMPIEAELYLAIRKSVLEDVLREVEDAAQRVHENDVAVTEEKSTASVKPKNKKYKGSAYCVRCKESRNFEGAIKTSDSGRQMAFGECPVCGTKVQRIRYADNETNYCPRCQTGGRVLADRRLSRLLR